MLSYFSSELETFVESDSLDFVSAGVLDFDSVLRPVSSF